MGRADLSRYRTASPSEARPIPFPPTVAWVLPELRENPASAIAQAILSVDNASTQREQVHAVKILGISLRDAHIEGAQKNLARFKCSCTNPASEVRPICHLAVPVLNTLLFETPAATGGLLSGALRSVLLCRQAGINGFDSPVQKFLARVAGWANKAEDEQDNNSPQFLEKNIFLEAAADVSALSVVLAEQKSRKWILDNSECILGVLNLICSINELYYITASSDRSKATRLLTPSTSSSFSARISTQVDRVLVEASCDSAMKAAQDIINFLFTSELNGDNLHFVDIKKAVERTTLACERVLTLPNAPRSSLMACAVAHVSGLLFQTARGESANCAANVLHMHILDRLEVFPPFARLSLLRSVMEAPAANYTHPILLIPPKGAKGPRAPDKSVFESLVSLTSANADVHLRYLSMDSLIACLRRLSPNELSAHCRDLVLSLIYERWQEPFPGVSSQIRQAMEALVNVDGGGDEAREFWLNMAKSLMKGNWDSKGIYAPLSVLVNRLGASTLLDVEPNCQSLAIRAAGNDSRLAKAASDWISTFWAKFWLECNPSKSRFYKIVNKDLVQCLVDDRMDGLRERTAEYMLPSYLQAIGQKNIKGGSLALLTYLDTTTERGSASRIRGTINVLSAARHRGVFMGSFSDPALRNLLVDALSSGLEDVRASALDLVVICSVPTAPIAKEEIDMVRSHIPDALMPGCSPSSRSRFRHSMRRFLERMAACWHAARDGSGGWWMRQRKHKYGGKRTPEFEKTRNEVLNRIVTFERDCIRLLLSSAYPGAPYARMTNSLEVLLLVCRNHGDRDFNNRVGSHASGIICGLLACLIDPWERPRRSALQILSSQAGPVSRFESIGEAEILQEFAFNGLMSPRQKEIDASASVFRFVFRRFVLEQQHTCKDQSTSIDVQKSLLFHGEPSIGLSAGSLARMYPPLAYACSVLNSLEAQVALAEQDFQGSCERGLFHGSYLLLRYIIQDLTWKDLCSPKLMSQACEFVEQFLSMAWRCTRIGMRGVSFDSLNCSHGTGEDFDYAESSSDVNDDDDILVHESIQLASTSCFLTMKEICICVGLLCHEVPFSVSGAPEDRDGGILTMKEISCIIDLFQFVFTNTRHWGVIDGASEGLQLLCEGLLQTPSSDLRFLPSKLIRGCLQSVLTGELYVLRRSAGIPAMFAAILNAEASKHTQSHDTPLLHETATVLLQHLQNSHMYVQEDALQKNRTEQENSVAHALNLLRSMFLNGNIASSILRYLEPAAMVCIKAFCSASWLIRNSTLMLFSALVRRGIGVCVERRSSTNLSSFEVADRTSAVLDGDRRLRGVTAFQFFSRHPNLHPFLLQQLETAVELFEYEGDTDHPSLFPTLYLLSSLSPSTVEDPTSALSMVSFRATLRKCLHWRSNYVRRVAAAACVPLIEDSAQVSKVVEDHMLTGIPTKAQRTEAMPRATATKSASMENGRFGAKIKLGKTRISQNHLHGELLALAAILRGMRQSMSRFDKCSTLTVLAKCLPDRVWIAVNPELNPCSVTRSCMIVVLMRSFEIAQDIRRLDTKSEIANVDADDVISLCREVALKINSCGEETYGLGMEVGFSSLLSSSAKLLAFISVSLYDAGTSTLHGALHDLLNLIMSSRPEKVLVGMRGVADLLRRKRGIVTDACAINDNEQDTLQRLGKVWRKAYSVANACDDQDQELLLESLRVQEAILLMLHTRDAPLNWVVAGVTSGDLASMLRIAQTHPCVDIREQATKLCGQLVALAVPEQHVGMEWISLIEDYGSSQQAPTTRIAAGSSFEKSGFGHLGQGPRPALHQELTVRGFLLLAKLLDDDDAEVRGHTMRIVHHCRRPTGEQNTFPSSILSSLTWIYDNLSENFSQSPSLFQHLEDQMKTSNELQKPGRDRLLEVVQLMLGQKVSNLSVARSTQPPGRRSSRSGHRSQRLFIVENDSSDAEALLHLQLVAWCYRKIILRQVTNTTVLCAKVSKMVSDLVTDLCSELKEATMPRELGTINGAVFTAQGFQRCYKSALRLFLGMTCLKSDSSSCASERLILETMLAERLSDILVRVGASLHFTIVNVISGLQDLLSDEPKEREEACLGRILFLLQV
ncbi:unnamed protein product [Chondrus crispus]|uniref:Uncharacterized protein n=1 Tax=Chondrus crispus TaxID=2769 RepID=R7QE02_CHOCR|nr:unnamed protein product [Chondrus crispus]CDF35681.1 unnamed protein product [Chondrus crispus]|eukprot:XP_005715500.1 unnamed protein product [Chondrus crispus]